MDDVKPPAPRTFDDVARAEDVPAMPSSKPVIAGNRTVQKDPMMSQTQATQTRSSSIPVVPPQGQETFNKKPTISNDTEPEQSSSVSSESIAPVAEPLHKLSHEEAMFGQMKPVKSRGKKVFIVLSTLLIMGAICYGTWYFLGSNKEVNQAKPAVIAPVVEKQKVNQPALPDGYVTYNSEDYGYSFNYPKEYGEFVKKPPVQSSGAQQAVFILQSSTPVNEYGPGITGPIIIQTYPSKDQVIESGKYGPTIQLKSGKWRVVATNESDASKNKVGDEYLDFNKKVIASQKNGTLEVYSLVSTDENKTSTRFIFVSKDTLQVITMPDYINDTLGLNGASKMNDKTSYNTLVKNILNSIYAK